MYSSLSTVMKEGNAWSPKSRNTKISTRDGENVAICSVCMDILGRNGGPASLTCGHNGCFGCLQKVQMNSRHPVCPVCRTPFEGDFTLGPDHDLRDALERAQVAEQDSGWQAALPEQSSRPWGGNYERQEESSQALALIKSPSQPQSRRLIYDLPLPEETGAWIPVSIPPKGYKEYPVSSPCRNSLGEGGWYADRAQYEEARQALPEVNLWNVLNGFLNIISGKTISQMVCEETSTQTWPELAQRYSARSGLVTLLSASLRL